MYSQGAAAQTQPIQAVQDLGAGGSAQASYMDTGDVTQSAQQQLNAAPAATVAAPATPASGCVPLLTTICVLDAERDACKPTESSPVVVLPPCMHLLLRGK